MQMVLPRSLTRSLLVVAAVTLAFVGAGGADSESADEIANATCRAVATHPDAIRGTGADQEIRGTADGDLIFAGGGNDTVHGMGGHDIICGNNGADRLFGGDGDDFIAGGGTPNGATERLLGGAGDDLIFGMDGRDRIDGGDGEDECHAAAPIDVNEQLKACEVSSGGR